MKTQRLLAVLTVVNLGLLMLLLVRIKSAEARSAASVLRGGALEIVDDQGKSPSEHPGAPSNASGRQDVP